MRDLVKKAAAGGEYKPQLVKLNAQEQTKAKITTINKQPKNRNKQSIKSSIHKSPFQPGHPKYI